MQNNRYRMYRRGRGMFYAKDRITGKAESLGTTDRAQALHLGWLLIPVMAEAAWPEIRSKKFTAITAKGAIIWRRLTDPTDVKIRRHCKIRSAANPFDPQWYRYFQQRALIKWYGENPLPQKGNPL